VFTGPGEAGKFPDQDYTKGLVLALGLVNHILELLTVIGAATLTIVSIFSDNLPALILGIAAHFI
jgi:hypothetical protein